MSWTTADSPRGPTRPASEENMRRPSILPIGPIHPNAASARRHSKPLDLVLQQVHSAGSGVVTALGQPIGQHPMPALGEHRLGVELHTLDVVPTVTKAHDHPAVGAGG